jgi:hypothetical protein
VLDKALVSSSHETSDSARGLGATLASEKDILHWYSVDEEVGRGFFGTGSPRVHNSARGSGHMKIWLRLGLAWTC